MISLNDIYLDVVETDISQENNSDKILTNSDKILINCCNKVQSFKLLEKKIYNTQSDIDGRKKALDRQKNILQEKYLKLYNKLEFFNYITRPHNIIKVDNICNSGANTLKTLNITKESIEKWLNTVLQNCTKEVKKKCAKNTIELYEKNVLDFNNTVEDFREKVDILNNIYIKKCNIDIKVLNNKIIDYNDKIQNYLLLLSREFSNSKLKESKDFNNIYENINEKQLKMPLIFNSEEYIPYINCTYSLESIIDNISEHNGKYNKLLNKFNTAKEKMAVMDKEHKKYSKYLDRLYALKMHLKYREFSLIKFRNQLQDKKNHMNKMKKKSLIFHTINYK